MKRLAALASIVPLGFLLSLGLASPAAAAAPCGTTMVNQDTFWVAVYWVPCEKAKRVVQLFEAAWTRPDRRSPFVHVLGFRCTGGLAGTQVTCWSWRKRIFASSRPEDTPASWKNPRPKLYRFTADHFSRKLMRRKYASWRTGYAKRSRCSKRINRRTLWCGTSWILGDSVSWANFRVRILPGRWQDKYRITGRFKRFDEYCAVVLRKPRSQCVRTSRLGPVTLR